MTSRAQVVRRIEGTRVLPHAHAHADSRHSRPLWDALCAGFTSLEVDVRVVGGRILVGHSLPRPWQSLQRLYLDPLTELLGDSDRIHPGSDRPITLLLDVKSAPHRARPVIEGQLRCYRGLVTCWRGHRCFPGAVTVVLSGTLSEAPYDAPERRTAVDGRLRATGREVSADLMPLRSDSWPELFSWAGEGRMPRDQRALLERMVGDAHARGQRVRFWDTPDRPGAARDNLWRTLLDAGVDLINTDDLSGARRFFLA